MFMQYHTLKAEIKVKCRQNCDNIFLVDKRLMYQSDIETKIEISHMSYALV